MPLGIYLDTPQGRKPATLPTHFSLHDFRNLIQKKVGNHEHYDYSLGDVIFRTWNEEVFNRQRSAIRDGVTVIVQYPSITVDPSDDSGLAWRHVIPGLCLEGVCFNINCRAFEQKVIANQGTGQCHLIAQSKVTSARCPSCGMSIEPITCAFNRCSWRLAGAKHGNGNAPTMLTTDWQDACGEYCRWKEHFSSWSQVTFETRQ